MKLKIILCSLLSLCFVPLDTLEARVADSRSALEDRLQKEGGRRYTRDMVQVRLDRSPLNAAMEFSGEMSQQFEAAAYWKPAGSSPGRVDMQGRNPPEGWDFYVIFVNGRSECEYYLRAGAGISDFEINYLLTVNRGSSFWKELTQEEKRSQLDSFWGYDYELDNGAYRAKRQGNGLLVFNANMDKQLRILRDKAREERRREQEQEAPSSVLGF